MHATTLQMLSDMVWIAIRMTATRVLISVRNWVWFSMA